MAYSFACADSGASCPGSFTTESRDELMAHLEMHTASAHPELAGNAAAAEQIGALVKQV